jgi:hypothetical protein
MKKNTTKNMLIRDLPLDQWEMVDSFCRRRKMKRREFIALALTRLEGQGIAKPLSAKQSKETARAAAEIQMVATQVQGLKSIITLKKEIDKLYDDVEYLQDLRTVMNVILELNRLQESFQALVTKWVPSHDIPDDPEQRRKMGLPERYLSDWVDIPADYKRKLDYSPAIQGDDEQTKSVSPEDPAPLKSKDNLSHDVESVGTREKKLVAQERVENYPKGETKASKKINTTIFGRGFEKIHGKDG